MRARSRRGWAVGVALALAAMVVLLQFGHKAEGSPAFARRYQTSCQTCHVAFPALTPFGEAFRRNGYRWPGGEDADVSHDEPVPLGQDAARRLFPDEVWPGQAPGMLPIAAIMEMEANFLDDSGDPRVDFSSIGGTAGLLVSGALDSTFSGWAQIMVGAEPVDGGGEEFSAELERAFMVMMPFDAPTLMLRLGRMDNALYGFTEHRTLGTEPIATDEPIDDATFAMDPAQLALEANGIVGAGRFSYTVGAFAETQGAAEPPDDFYVRLAYKLGGMRLDGIGGATQSLPWRDDSVQIGAFGLRGRTRFAGDAGTQIDDFYRVGGDINAIFWDLNLEVAYIYGDDNSPRASDPNQHVTSQDLFSQLNWVAYPWLIPSVRFERRDVEDEDATNRVIPAVFFLLRANLEAQLYATLEGDGSWDLTQITASLRAGF